MNSFIFTPHSLGKTNRVTFLHCSTFLYCLSFFSSFEHPNIVQLFSHALFCFSFLFFFLLSSSWSLNLSPLLCMLCDLSLQIPNKEAAAHQLTCCSVQLDLCLLYLLGSLQSDVWLECTNIHISWNRYGGLLPKTFETGIWFKCSRRGMSGSFQNIRIILVFLGGFFLLLFVFSNVS